MEKELILCDTNIFIFLIAATALTFNLKLFTYNRKDFQFIPGLRVCNRINCLKIFYNSLNK
jgi:hypothetical protein